MTQTTYFPPTRYHDATPSQQSYGSPRPESSHGGPVDVTAIAASYRVASQAFLLKHYAQAWSLCVEGLHRGRLATNPNNNNNQNSNYSSHTPLLSGAAGPRAQRAYSNLPVETSSQQWWVLYLTLIGTLMDGTAEGVLARAPGDILLGPRCEDTTLSIGEEVTRGPHNGTKEAPLPVSAPISNPNPHHLLSKQLYSRKMDEEFEATAPFSANPNSKSTRPRVLSYVPHHLDDIWDLLLASYGSCVHLIPGEVVVAAVLLALQYHALTTASGWIEAWYSGLPDPVLDLLESDLPLSPPHSSSSSSLGSQSPVVMTRTRREWYCTYEQISELYLLHVLPRMNQWSSAQVFVDYNQVLSSSTKEYFIGSLKRLERSHKAAAQRAKKRQLRKRAASQATVNTTTTSISTDTSARVRVVPNPITAGNGLADLPNEPVVLSKPTLSSDSPTLATTTSSPRGSALDSPPEGSRSTAVVRSSSSSYIGRRMQAVQLFLETHVLRHGHFLVPVLMAVVCALALHALRRRVPPFLRTFLAKIWQTLVMGASTSYM
ncbi:hypothetical protein H4R33_002066 [Dimargaris cristalligena]|nr:hypothetical protein H4R33_002066 [Dimargaris cristalligena]